LKLSLIDDPDKIDKSLFIGKFLAKSIIEKINIPMHLQRHIWKLIVGKSIMCEDFESSYPGNLDLMKILDYDLKLIGLDEDEFNFTLHEGNISKEIKLSEDFIQLNDENKFEYLKLRIKSQFDIFKEIYENILIGFYTIIPKNVIEIFTHSELELLVCGDQLNVEEWKKNTEYIDCDEKENEITWFWEIIKEEIEKRKKRYCDQII